MKQSVGKVEMEGGGTSVRVPWIEGEVASSLLQHNEPSPPFIAATGRREIEVLNSNEKT